ncbi:MAG: Glu-tRNA(Gln) amidotransferase subunit GatE [Nanoarchaeota archaeon]|nr:Glu-tRNA(Gln) amidotransferase subunit GatE [Nanoarchaeota archaeon]MBU4300837.1 Glu-tRNA(Gln) amidotransferase subunit GatE [Nanoarchaeota archaeon]MBU4452018.1 Glu-tRNA(Gln) amidotransferase subunit GatE [Nanoarchaeota archaeon]MCG2724469.1 Glu-tRNA(Gln) amidotransferase subunit GatE [archaeon]
MELDYQKMGFKCGIEIHRRLKTKKLFCNCATDVDEASKSEITRKLRAVAGELGKVDAAVMHELGREKEFIYKIYPKSSCLVEMDEEPPHSVNQDALKISLLISKMFSAKIPQELHFMRKTVIDGSNTSGFQRTAIVGIDGNLETSKGFVGIANISLEEESCQILETRDGETVFGLNRLGIPLVEIGTAPDIKSPEHAKETAEKIGMLLKSTGNVMRGIGTIRQDVNVSIKDGARTEIKGAQDLKMIPELVNQEVLRQTGLLNIKQKLQERDFKKQELYFINATSVFKGSQSKILGGKEIYAIKLEKIAGLFKEKLNDFRTLGNEVAGFARAKAKVKGIIHSDEDLAKYGIINEFVELRKFLGAKDGDLIAIVAADKNTAENAMNAVLNRVNELLDGVPKETRRALANGDSEFMRPLPGAARMYPETDVAPIVVLKSEIRKIKRPETLDEKFAHIQKEIGGELAGQIIASDYLDIFESIAEKHESEKKTIAIFFTNTLPQLKSRENIEIEKISEAIFREIFELLSNGKIEKNKIAQVVLEYSRTGKPISEIISAAPKISAQDLEKILEEIILREKTGKMNVIIGAAMKELAGRASGKEIAEVLKRIIAK